ncbi:hypothetical protein DL765_000176 [Monosporascus sp. GIB2]|nr:hypothetical protein DL765_000176 [Monosporascus sp. GIB2]
MAQRAPIESYVAVSPAPDLGADVYTNERPLSSQKGRGSVFGGLLMSQAISAASATVPQDFYAYTSSSSFLRPVTQERVVYRVERLTDGRNYATRQVRAAQGGADGSGDNLVYVATVSFQSKRIPSGKALDYAAPAPVIGNVVPDDIPKHANRRFFENYQSGSLQAFKPEDEPFDWRPARHTLTRDPTEYRATGFSRSQPLSDHSTAVNLAALAYMSDELLLGIAIFANPEVVGPQSRNVAMAASLNHHIWFHDPNVRVDEWMVGERWTSCGADGRTLIHQRIWDLKSGRLVMTCTQEALIRLKSASKL